MSERRHLQLASQDAEPLPAVGTDTALAHELDLPDDALAADDDRTLYNAVGLRFEAARIFEYDAGDAPYAKGERVVCEAPHGIAWATVAVASRRLLLRGRLPRVLRRTTEGDDAAEAQLRAREQTVWAHAREVARALALPLKIVRAEALHGGQKFVIYFASEDKIQYRDLLRGIAQGTRERVELRQMGMRDAAKIIGGVGPCGLQLCCNTFLSDFAPVTIKMAKDQGLALNPQKVSGVCGRLLCCLVYEEAFYRAQRKLLPRMGERVKAPEGEGIVRDVDVLEMRVRVSLDSGETVTRAAAELEPIRGPGRDRKAD